MTLVKRISQVQQSTRAGNVRWVILNERGSQQAIVHNANFGLALVQRYNAWDDVGALVARLNDLGVRHI